MTKAEIRNKFDEIVAFAEIEKFIDTPVKRYSSGMYVRLAFAVAAHLEPEILIVDEVLAVGDFEFQKKCLGKMQDVSRGGRTVLFVSHNMSAVERLCQRAVLLKGGQIAAIDRVHAVTQEYIKTARGESETAVSQMKSARFEVRDLQFLPFPSDLEVKMDVICDRSVAEWGVGFQFESVTGDIVSILRPPNTGLYFRTDPAGNEVQVNFPGIMRLLPEGDYLVSLWFVGGADSLLALKSVYCLHVPANDPYGTGRPFVQGTDGVAVIPVESKTATARRTGAVFAASATL
jgi:energy-coupling factor transporter ATP-binding protein EcfA2